METITMIIPMSNPSVNGFLPRGRRSHDENTTPKTIIHIPTREWTPVKTRGLASVRGGRPPEGAPAIISRPFSAAPRIPEQSAPPRWGPLPLPANPDTTGSGRGRSQSNSCGRSSTGPAAPRPRTGPPPGCASDSLPDSPLGYSSHFPGNIRIDALTNMLTHRLWIQ